VSGQVGKLAVNDMSKRIERWRARKEKAAAAAAGQRGGSGNGSVVAGMGRVGGAVESVYNERYDCTFVVVRGHRSRLGGH
jgi:hypothetical protein